MISRSSEGRFHDFGIVDCMIFGSVKHVKIKHVKREITLIMINLYVRDLFLFRHTMTSDNDMSYAYFVLFGRGSI